jgi:uncharacterized membrane-anchored protein
MSEPVNRVPHIIVSYWVIKIASTTLGETGADMFSMGLDLGYATTIAMFLVVFLVLLAVKLSRPRYDPVSYWTLFTSTAILGTAISDFIDRTLGLGYTAGSALLVTLLIITLAVWRIVEGSVSVERIEDRRGELFYWAAFLIANTLGTAAGDFISDDLGIGFLYSAVLITGVLVLLALAYYVTRVNRVLLFWLAFVLTRPFGATFGDLLTKSPQKGGLELGTFWTSLFFAVAMALALVREARAERRRAA